MAALTDFLIEKAALRSDRDALGERTAAGWRWWNWGEFADRAHAVAAALIACGLQPGRSVGIVSRSRHEWVEVEFGTLLAGGVVVPLHPTTPAAGALDLARRADIGVVFAEGPLQAEKLLGALAPNGPVRKVVAFDSLARLPGADARGRLEVALADVAAGADAGAVSAFSDLLSLGNGELRRGARAEIDRRRTAIRPEDPATIVFTPGDPGGIHGAVLTHDNVSFTTATLGAEMGVTSEDRTLLFLPLAHVYARLLVWTAVQVGVAVAFAEDAQSVLRDAAEIRPDFLIAVPRFLENVRQGLDREIGAAPVWRRGLVRWAMRVSGERETLRRDGRDGSVLLDAQCGVAERLVRRSLRDRLGGRLRFVVSGGAPLAPSTRDFFESVGVPVLEGYGMTEGTALATFTRPGECRPGTVGAPVPGVEVRVAPDGEILFRGRNVMRGYLDEEAATARVLDADGWVHSGDLGILDDDGFLRITGRKKDLIVTEGGKNVSPRHVESILRQSPIVRDVAAIGDRRPYVTALVVLDPREIGKIALLEGIILVSPDEMGDHPAVRAMVEDAVSECNRRLEPFQMVRAFAVVPDLGDAPAGDDPASARARRLEIEKRYSDRIEAMYRRGQ